MLRSKWHNCHQLSSLNANLVHSSKILHLINFICLLIE